MDTGTNPLSLLDPAGVGAAEAATLWWGMFAFFTLVYLGVLAAWAWAIRRPPDPAHTDPARRHTAMIVGGGVLLPSLSVLVLLIISIPAGNRMSGVSSDNAEGSASPVLEIEVTGHQWWWQVLYPDSGRELRDEIHIPVGMPVRLNLSSADVIHSFWVPRIAQKLDMIPGRVNQLHLQANEVGVYPGVCAEFCGLAHAHMKFTLHVHSREDFAAWQDAGDNP